MLSIREKIELPLDSQWSQNGCYVTVRTSDVPAFLKAQRKVSKQERVIKKLERQLEKLKSQYKKDPTDELEDQLDTLEAKIDTESGKVLDVLLDEVKGRVVNGKGWDSDSQKEEPITAENVSHLSMAGLRMIFNALSDKTEKNE